MEHQNELMQERGIRQRVSNAIDSMKRGAVRRVDSVKTGVDRRVENTRNDMTTNPFKWAGVAAGASMVLGLAARYLRHRMHRPQIIYVR